MNTIKKIILPVLIAGSTLMYSCKDDAEHKITSVRIQGINIEGIASTDMISFSERDGKPGFDAITGNNGYAWTYFCKTKFSDDDYGIIPSDSTQKYMNRLQQDLEKLEKFTKMDYDKAMKK